MCIFFGKMPLQVLCPFFNWVVWFSDRELHGSSYIGLILDITLDINPSSDTYFASVLPHQ